MTNGTEFTSIEALRSRYYPSSVSLITLDREEPVALPTRMVDDALRTKLRRAARSPSHTLAKGSRTRKSVS